jgi:RHS repeat-associated protein
VGRLQEVYEVRRPDATVVNLRYDRECELVRVVNQRGDNHTITRNPAGRIVKEETFDGRTLRYKTDTQGGLEQIRADRALTTIERDEVGRVVTRTFEDGTEHSFEYDLAGRLTRASTGSVTVCFAYDARGNVVSEKQIVDGVEHHVARAYDERGLCTRLQTSLGHVRTLRFDRMGTPSEIVLDGAEHLAFAYDGCGKELGRTLPGGATIETARDVMGWATARRITSPAGRVTVEQSFQRREDGAMVLFRDRDRGATEYVYDPVGALIERIPEKARAEVFRQDGAGAADDGTSPRFAPGGRLVERDGVRYVYDARGRLVEKRDAASQKWMFEWTAAGLLSSVKAADGSVTRYRYDCFARRVERKRSSADGSTERTRWIWDREDLVHEVRERAQKGRDPIVEERTYVDKPGSMELVAEGRRVGPSAEQKPEWRYVVSDSRWAPELLVDENGTIVEDVRLTAFGAPERPTPAGGTVARFAGHWLDEDTGLFYNRHRYYDPQIGRYVSPEPLGLAGGLSAYTYADQSPYELVDPNGLLGMNATASGPAGSFTRGSASTEGVPSSSVALHPVVVNALSTTSHHNIPFSSDPRSPRACAEPRAVSDYLHAYEQQHGVALDPNTEEGRGHIHNALSEMHVGANQADNGHPRAPCRNCSQFFANLMEQHGAPSPGNIAAGHRSASAGGGTTNFTPPRPGRPGHQAYPIPG